MRNLDYKPIIIGNTANMTPEQFTEVRKHGGIGIPYTMGGSDAGKVIYPSKYKGATILDLFYDKINQDNPNYKRLSGNDFSLERGHILEPYIVELVRKKYEEDGYEVEIVNDTSLYRHGEIEIDRNGNPIIEPLTGQPKLRYGFFLANLDRLIRLRAEGEDWSDWMVLEIKSLSGRAFDTIENWKKGIVPRNYDTQVRCYLSTTNLNKAIIACCWGFDKDDLACVDIERDIEVETYIMDSLKGFVEYNLINQIEPDITSVKMTGEQANYIYSKIYGMQPENKQVLKLNSNAALVDKVKFLSELQKELDKANEEVKLLKDKIDAEGSSILPLLEGAKKATLSLGNGKYVYIEAKSNMKKSRNDEAVELLLPEAPIYKQTVDTKLFNDYVKKNKIDTTAMYIQPIDNYRISISKEYDEK